MKLIIDIRERDLVLAVDALRDSDIRFKSLTYYRVPLDIGDVIMKDDNGKDLIIIERKSVSDLIASIKDGRYSEQSYRLSGSDTHNHNIVYLIEGTISPKLKERQAVFSAMTSLNYCKGFSVFRTTSLAETAYYICNTIWKLEKETCKKPYSSSSNTMDSSIKASEGYVSVVKKVKKDNITMENFGEIVLCQIPGISVVTAKAIMERYKTLCSLLDAMKLDPNCLDGLTYTTTKDQTRKINKSCATNIRNLLL